MKLTLTILLLFCGLPFDTFAQPASKAAHNQGAKAIQARYNAREFTAIYAQLSEHFKSTITEPEFVAFLTNDLYTPYGELERVEFLADNNGPFAYRAFFKQGVLRMNLLMNLQGEIEGLQFLPYALPPAGKRLDYASDNKKQSGLDLFIDSLVTPYMQSPQNCGLSIGIRRNGTNYFYNYGEVKRNSGQLPDATTIYETGSLSKTFCGILLAQAVTDRKIKLDDDIRDYLPGHYPNLAYGSTPILIKHLANHTSGLPRIPEDLLSQPGFDSLNPYKQYHRQDVLHYLKTAELAHVPGTVCDYSNLGMALLGIILADMYHQTFEALVKEKITDPNHMGSTGITLSVEQQARFAEGYNQDGQPTPHWEMDDMAAAGGIRSTAQDMLRYLSYNLAEGDEATRLAHRATYSGRETLGLAWFIKKTAQGHTLLWHNGGTYGFTAFEGFIKEKNCALILLSNSAGYADHLAIAILNYLQQ